MIKIKINPQCAWGRDNEIRSYVEAIYGRQEKYGVEIDDSYMDIANEVNDYGTTKVKNFIDPDMLLLVKNEFEAIKDRENYNIMTFILNK